LEAEIPDNSESFSRLRMINPEIRGWITMEGTGIDFPVLQGQNNMSYINRDFFGNFSLAGSIFLDSRDDPEFGEGYALLYGHHMADGNMFGDLDRYQEEPFFMENRTGILILPEKSFVLEVIACMTVPASARNIFDPEYVRANPHTLLPYAREKADHFREADWKEEKWIALTTCASEFTDARTVVLARMEPLTIGEQEE
jgi:sortase B